jgi:hypothetical protein
MPVLAKCAERLLVALPTSLITYEVSPRWYAPEDSNACACWTAPKLSMAQKRLEKLLVQTVEWHTVLEHRLSRED